MYDEFNYKYNNKKYDIKVCGDKKLKGYIHGTCISKNKKYLGEML